MNARQSISSQLNTRGNGECRVELLATLQEQLDGLGWSASDTFSIQLAVEEAVANAYRHGNQEGQRGDVNLRWEISESSFVMEVRDQGDGFDESDVPNPTDVENLEKLSGRGLLLMRSYMSAVEFGDGGRLVVMRKSKSEPAAD